MASEVIHDFWRSEAMKALEPEPCAAEVLPRLYAQGWRFVAITACTDEPAIVEARIANLKKAFGFDFEAVHCSGMCNGGKAEVLAQYEPAVWVEDHFHNAIAGGLLGHKTFLMDRPYNQDMQHGYVTRVKDWHEIEEYLKGK